MSSARGCERPIDLVIARRQVVIPLSAPAVGVPGALKPGITPGRAADMLWFFFGPNAWYSLVGDRGWTFAQAAQWLLEAARRDLLKEPAS